MSEKRIVNTSWLPFSAAASHEILQELILAAALSSVRQLPRKHGLTAQQIQFAMEKSAQIDGTPATLLKLSEASDLSSDHVPVSEMELWEERVYLRGFALSRLERNAEATKWFRVLPRKFQSRIDGERALFKANHGDFEGAIKLFRSALLSAGADHDPFSACTLRGGLAFATIQQGDFKSAQGALEQRRQILRAHPSAPLSFGTQLYEIMLLLERNDFQSAAEQLRLALVEQNLESVNGFFLLHLRLRLHLARNELNASQQALDDLQHLAVRLQLPEGVLDFRLEQIELELRTGDLKRAAFAIEKLAQHASRRRDEYLNFRLSLLESQALLRDGKIEASLKEIERAVDQGESKGYRPGLTWAFFHAAGIALAAGKPVQARLFLNRGRKLTAELGLKARGACFSYMSEVLDRRYASASALIALAKQKLIGPELEYFLDGYQLLESVKLIATSFGAQEEVAEPRLRRMLFLEPGIFWFQKEGVLLANLKSSGVFSVELAAQPLLTSVFRLFWSALQKQQAGLKLSDIHRAKSEVAYREDLHASSAKMLLSRLREKIKICGITIGYDREAAVYSFKTEQRPFTIRSSSDTVTVPLTREQELLARIAMEPFVSTKTLCEEFGVTRQALHPHLKRLAKLGYIRIVKRGPVSGYILRA